MTKPIVIEAHTRYATSVIFSPDGKKLISGGFKGELREWEAGTWKMLAVPAADSKVRIWFLDPKNA